MKSFKKSLAIVFRQFDLPATQIVVLFGMALVASGLYLLRTARVVERHYEQDAANNIQRYADRTLLHMEQNCRKLPPAAGLKCTLDAAEAFREARRKESDLQAQLVTSAWTRSMGIAAIFGLIASIIGVVLVFRTFKATGHANKIAEDTAKHQLRAYVGVQEIHAEPDPSFKAWRISIHWVNAGQTPASNVVSGIQSMTGSASELALGDLSKTNRVSGVTSIAPNQTIVTSARETVSLDIVRKVHSGNEQVIFWGWIEYSDIYSNSPRRRTECAFQMRTKRTAGVSGVDIGFVPLDRHNGMDADCMFKPTELGDIQRV